MRVTWNGTDVDHSTLIFYDEISNFPHRYLRRDPFGTKFSMGALVCRFPLWAEQNWYLADGTLTDKTYASHRLNTYHTRERVRPDYARLNRRKDRYQHPRSRNQNGLWSCRWGKVGLIFAAAFVGVYERRSSSVEDRKLDRGLGTGTQSDLAILWPELSFDYSA